MLFNPTILYLIYSVFLVFLIFYYKYDSFKLNSLSLQGLFFITLGFLSLWIGMLSFSIYVGLNNIKRSNLRECKIAIPKSSLKFVNLFIIVGILGTLLKAFYLLSKYGFSLNLKTFVSIRLDYLTGALSIPLVLLVLSHFLYIGVALSFFEYLSYKKPIYIIKHYVIILFIVINDVIIGGRGAVAFTLVLSTVLFIYSIYFKLIDKKSIKVFALIYIIGLIISIYYFMSVSITREGNEDIKYALDMLVLYLVGPFYATDTLFQIMDINILPDTFGFYTFGAFSRFFSSYFGITSLDFGYVPIYKDLQYGFNSFTIISYLVKDFGAITAFLLMFILGIYTQYLFYSLHKRFSTKKFLVFVMLIIVVLFSPRDVATKWLSFWLVLISIFLYKFNCKPE